MDDKNKKKIYHENAIEMIKVFEYVCMHHSLC